MLARWTNILSRLIKANQINLLSGLFDHNSDRQRWDVSGIHWENVPFV